MHIRPMVLGDAPRIQALSEQLGYPQPLQIVEARVAKILSLSGHLALVAEQTEVAAWIHCFISDLIEYPTTFVEIGGLVVDERYRGQGVGASLVRAAEDWTRAQGLLDIKVRSASHRAGAHEFYSKHGFTLQKTQMRFVKSL